MKHLKVLVVLFVLCCYTQVFAQWRSHTIVGNGDVVTKTLAVSNFEGLAVSGNFEVTLVQGNTKNITLLGESNLLEAIVVEVSGKSLKIAPAAMTQLKPSKGKKIQINVPVINLTNIAMSGSGYLKSDQLLEISDLTLSLSGSGTMDLKVKVSTISTSVSGSGKIHLSGTANVFKGSVSGSGRIEALALIAAEVKAAVSGSGQLSVFCDESLNATVSGSGKIIYKGSPAKKDTKVSGSGKITTA
jgi:hypothetical protein